MRNHGTLATLTAGTLLAAGLVLLSGCNEPKSATAESGNMVERHDASPSRTLQAGTRIQVALGGDVSSKTAQPGDVWHGTVTQDVAVQNGGSIPPGSEVDGVVVSATPAERGSRAMLELGIRSIRVNGRSESIHASAEPVIAGSTRKRNVGAVAGGALAGALIGKSVGDGKNGAVGGLIGGAAAAGVVAGSKGFQVVLSDGTVMSFTVSRTVAMR